MFVEHPLGEILFLVIKSVTDRCQNSGGDVSSRYTAPSCLSLGVRVRCPRVCGPSRLSLSGPGRVTEVATVLRIVFFSSVRHSRLGLVFFIVQLLYIRVF